jgi:hypothetical protein
MAFARCAETGWDVFYEKASDVKAALAAGLIGSSELRSVPESSIRTLKEPLSLGSVHDGVPPPRRCNLYGGLKGSRRPAQSPRTGGWTRAPIEPILLLPGSFSCLCL